MNLKIVNIVKSIRKFCNIYDKLNKITLMKEGGLH